MSPSQYGSARQHSIQNRTDDVLATYKVRSTNIGKAAEAIAIGQSIGNPNVRLRMETPEMWRLYGCDIRRIEEGTDGEATVVIGYPLANFTPRSLTHILTSLMGGQMDIDLVEGCRLVGLELPPALIARYRGAWNGIGGVRSHLGAHGRALVGGIVKPKTGITPDQVADICVQMADGGIDFIKEDEILGDLAHCPLMDRVEKVVRRLESYKVVYCPCVTAPVDTLAETVNALRSLNCAGLHYNIWGGMDAYQYVVRLGEGMFCHYQKSGDRVITDGRFSIDFTVWCQLVRLAGADFIHVGMVGGYLSEPPSLMAERLDVLRKPWGHLKPLVPALSCGATPGMVAGLVELFGTDIMINSGGGLHGHPMGTRAGAKAFRDAAEGLESRELSVALDLWGR